MSKPSSQEGLASQPKVWVFRSSSMIIQSYRFSLQIDIKSYSNFMFENKKSQIAFKRKGVRKECTFETFKHANPK